MHNAYVFWPGGAAWPSPPLHVLWVQQTPHPMCFSGQYGLGWFTKSSVEICSMICLSILSVE